MDIQILRGWQNDKNVNAGVRQIIGMAADEIERLQAALKAISMMRREDLYYADGYEHDNMAAAYAAEALNK